MGQQICVKLVLASTCRSLNVCHCLLLGIISIVA